jgi:glycosyltransferase involved in cell wall biosynthesis
MVTHLRLLSRGFEEQGIRFALAAPPGTELGGLAAAAHPIPIRSRPHPIDDLRAARATARFAKTHDLIHGHGLRGAWIAALAARFARKPFVFTAHNLAPRTAGLLSRFALQYVVRHAARVICISHAVADSLKPYGLTGGKIALIPNGIDLAPYAAQHPTPNTQHQTPNIVALGRLSPEKGFSTLIDAAAYLRIQFPEARIAIAGDGPERASLAAQVSRLGLGEVVSLPGRVEDSAALLMGAEIVVVPSLEEGQGIVALEAMAARKPVVASHVGGLVETVEDGITGVLVPPGAPKALASALARLLSEPEAWEVMGAAGRARVEAEYTADKMVERTTAVYREVASQLTP